MPGHLLIVGLSHHTAPVELRERLAVGSEELASELRRAMDAARASEGVLISTCNRVEMVMVVSHMPTAAEGVLSYFNQRLAPDRADPYVYQYPGSDAVRHLFRVASGLDSMVLGEPQILGQVKEAFSCAHRAGKVGTLLSRCFHHAFATGKRVRTDTAVAAGQVSVSSIACALAEKVFGELSGRRVLLVGAGEMSAVAARTMTAHGARLFVVNRSEERAQELAQAFGGTARDFSSLASELAEADVVISSTANPGFVISPELVQGVAKSRRSRPLFIIDIAVPRDVDPRVSSLPDVFLYDIDDLQKAADDNLAARRREAGAAEQIIEEGVGQFEKWMQSLQLTPTIVALRERFRSVMHEEMERTLPRLSSMSDKDRRALEAMGEAVVNKLLHKPLTALKSGNHQTDEVRLIDVTQQLFRLEVEAPAPTDEADKEHKEHRGRS